MLPVLPIFAATTVLVPNAAVGEQNGHVNNVEVRQDVLKATSQAIGQRAHQISRVVEMTCPAPKARGHQLAVVLGPIHGHVVRHLLDLLLAVTQDQGDLSAPCRQLNPVWNILNCSFPDSSLPRITSERLF